MTKVKIQSTRHYGIKTKLGKEVVEFDKKGVAEVSKEIWEQYKEMPTLFEFGKVPVKETKEEANSNDPAEIAELKSMVARYKGIAEEKEKKVKEAIESEKVWREKAGELIAENEELKTTINNLKQANGEEVKEIDSDSELRAKLNEMHHKALPKFLKEVLGLDEVKVDSLKSKEEMIEFAISSANE